MHTYYTSTLHAESNWYDCGGSPCLLYNYNNNYNYATCTVHVAICGGTCMYI